MNWKNRKRCASFKVPLNMSGKYESWDSNISEFEPDMKKSSNSNKTKYDSSTCRDENAKISPIKLGYDTHKSYTSKHSENPHLHDTSCFLTCVLTTVH